MTLNLTVIVTLVVFWNAASVLGWSCPNSTRLDYLIPNSSFNINPFWRTSGPAQSSNTLDGENLFAVEGGPNDSAADKLPASGDVSCITDNEFPSWTLPYGQTGNGADSAGTQRSERLVILAFEQIGVRSSFSLVLVSPTTFLHQSKFLATPLVQRYPYQNN
eukprot:TRINITY_DN2612_c0_g1_i3.p1 TRINITY_DN2612_c0_g1~~TRINITY_DN2612_c0_g1_i3.p1  ORF type:complete len:162 (+),score=5.02 TRINITY_DN2612_c0_g1_i3:158-643(+)